MMTADLQPHYHFCTYFDSNYLNRGIALYDSLIRSCQKPFTLWVLCFDDETYSTLTRLNLVHMRLVSLADFENGNAELVHTKATRSQVEYYWTCTPAWPLYILQHSTEVEVITYLDADLLFYSDPRPIYEELGNASILIIEHRYAPEHQHLAIAAGIYNVGLIAFRRDTNGLACLQHWRQQCLDWCYARYEPGKFGDQKYLDDWTERFQGVVVLKHKGANLAPWNLGRFPVHYQHREISVDGQPLIFYHFHGYKEINQQTVLPANHDYEISVQEILYFYLPYGEQLNAIHTRLGKQLPSASYRTCLRLLFDSIEQSSQPLLIFMPKPLSLWWWFIGKRICAGKKQLKTAIKAYTQGKLSLAKIHCISAVRENPLLLRKQAVQSVLLESVIGPAHMNYWRQVWRQIRLNLRHN